MREKSEDAEARATLGVEPQATPDQVREAYLRESQKWRIRRTGATTEDLRRAAEAEEERLRRAVDVLLGESPPVVATGSALVTDDLVDSAPDAATMSRPSGADPAVPEPTVAAPDTIPPPAAAPPEAAPISAAPVSRAPRDTLLGVIVLTCAVVGWLEFGHERRGSESPQPVAEAQASGGDEMATPEPTAPDLSAPSPEPTVVQEETRPAEEAQPAAETQPVEETAAREEGAGEAAAVEESPAPPVAEDSGSGPAVVVDAAIFEVGDGHDDSRRAIVSVLERWVQAVRDGDSAAFAAAYAPVVSPYFGKRSQGRAAIGAGMNGQLERYSARRALALSELDIEMSEPGVAVVNYRKEWDFRSPTRRYAGAEQERLTMRELEGTWQIAGETEVKVHWVSREPVKRAAR